MCLYMLMYYCVRSCVIIIIIIYSQCIIILFLLYYYYFILSRFLFLSLYLIKHLTLMANMLAVYYLNTLIWSPLTNLFFLIFNVLLVCISCRCFRFLNKLLFYLILGLYGYMPVHLLWEIFRKINAYETYHNLYQNQDLVHVTQLFSKDYDITFSTSLVGIQTNIF